MSLILIPYFILFQSRSKLEQIQLYDLRKRTFITERGIRVDVANSLKSSDNLEPSKGQRSDKNIIMVEMFIPRLSSMVHRKAF